MHAKIVPQNASSLHFICFPSLCDEKVYSIFAHPLACLPSSVSQQTRTCLYDRAWSKDQWDLSSAFPFGSSICYYRLGARAISFSDFSPSGENCLISTYSLMSKLVPHAPPLSRKMESPPHSPYPFQRPDLTSNPLEAMSCLHSMNNRETLGSWTRYLTV